MSETYLLEPKGSYWRIAKIECRGDEGPVEAPVEIQFPIQKKLIVILSVTWH